MFHQRVPARQFRRYEVDMSALAGANDERRPSATELVDEKKVDVEQLEVAPALAK
jgi:hypothetical protein